MILNPLCPLESGTPEETEMQNYFLVLRLSVFRSFGRLGSASVGIMLVSGPQSVIENTSEILILCCSADMAYVSSSEKPQSCGSHDYGKSR